MKLFLIPLGMCILLTACGASKHTFTTNSNNSQCKNAVAYLNDFIYKYPGTETEIRKGLKKAYQRIAHPQDMEDVDFAFISNGDDNQTSTPECAAYYMISENIKNIAREKQQDDITKKRADALFGD